jgi:hypothetical protein
LRAKINEQNFPDGKILYLRSFLAAVITDVHDAASLARRYRAISFSAP